MTAQWKSAIQEYRYPKPAACEGCPFFGDGQGFCPDETHPENDVVYVAQNPGETEEVTGIPLSGKTGTVFNEQLLPKAGHTRGDTRIGVMNVLKCRWQHTNDLPSGPALDGAIAHCLREHFRLPANARYVVAMGAPAAGVLAGVGGKDFTITDVEGTVVDGIGPAAGKPVFCIRHPADLYHDAKMKGPVFRFFRKIGRITRPGYQEPTERFLLNPSLKEYVEYAEHIETAPWIACDTEYWSDEATHQIKGVSCIGVSGPDGYTLSIEKDKVSDAVWYTFIDHLAAWAGGVPGETPKRFVFHEAMADLPALAFVGVVPKLYDDTIIMHHALWCELPHDLAFCMAMYTHRRYHKHLRKHGGTYYNAKDVVGTVELYTALLPELEADPLAAKSYQRRMRTVPIALEAQQGGLALNPENVTAKATEAIERIEAGKRELWAVTGWRIDPDSPKQLSEWAYDRLDFKPGRKKRGSDGRSFDRDALARLTKEHPDNVFLSAVRHYRRGAHDLRHFVLPCLQADGSARVRLYYRVSLHSQNTTRWSLVEPPVGTTPQWLMDMYEADPTENWLAFDYDAIELRLNAFIAGDKPYLEAFEKGYDVHTIHACQTFGWPLPSNLRDPHTVSEDAEWRASWRVQWGDRPSPIPGWDGSWLGKDDPRRTFNKRAAYKLSYGGLPENMDDIPEAEVLGLDANALKEWGRRYLAYHPAISVLHTKIAAQVAETRLIRAWDGRRWILLGALDKATREAYDYPMQAGTQAIMEDTLVEVKGALPFIRLRMLKHDGALLGFPRKYDVRTIRDAIKPMVEAARDIVPGKPPYVFPATFKTGRNLGHMEKVGYESSAH